MRCGSGLVGRDELRAETAGRVEVLADGPLAALALIRSHRAVVERAVAGDRIERAVFRCMARARPDNNRELRFVIESIANARHEHWLLVTDQ